MGHLFDLCGSYKDFLTLRLVSSLNNPQSNKNEILWKYEVDMLKIIVIIIYYILNNFTTHITIP